MQEPMDCSSLFYGALSYDMDGYIVPFDGNALAGSRSSPRGRIDRSGNSRKPVLDCHVGGDRHGTQRSRGKGIAAAGCFRFWAGYVK